MQIIITWFPFVVSLLCIAFMMMARYEIVRYPDRRMMDATIWYLTIIAGTFASWICYLLWPEAYVGAFALCYFCSSFTTVALYRVICEITLTRFLWWHYFIPIVMTLIVLIWSSMIPPEVKLGIVHGLGKHDPNYPAFSAVFTSVLVTKSVFNLLYASQSVKRYLSYRGKMKADTPKPYMLQWLKTVLILVCASVFIPVLTLVIGKNNTGVVAINSAAVSCSVVCLIMTVNVLKGNYPVREKRRIIVSEAVIEPDKPRKRRTVIRPENKIDKEELADFKNKIVTYFNAEKPYLDPKLKLETLAEQMGYTRNCFSALVNQAYRMNFNTFINRWRLKELAAISKASATKRLSRARQVILAGFGSYDSYQRAEQHAEATKAKRSQKPKKVTDTNRSKKNDNG